MVNLEPVVNKEVTLTELTMGFTIDDLRREANTLLDAVVALVDDCTDEDVVFETHDPDANDDNAATEAERNIGWTLGHVIVHVTAGSEEGAFTGAELARGVEFHGRSRYEVPWQAVTTMAQVRHRLVESRRMQNACLDIWPDEPHLDNTIYYDFMDEHLNAVSCYAFSLGHLRGHLDQIEEIVRQAKEAR